MAKPTVQFPSSAKAQDAVEKSYKATLATADKAIKAGKETTASALKSTTAAVSQAYEETVAATQEQVQNTFPQVADKFENVAGFQRDNLEALFAAGAVVMKGAETLTEEVIAYNKKAMEDGMAGTKKLFDCRTMQDLIAVQSELARLNFEALIAHGTKLTDLTMKLATEVASPLQDRVAKTAEKIGRPLAA